MPQDKTFGIVSKIFIALFAAFFAHMMIVAILGSFYDNRQLQELLGGNSTLPVFIPTLILFELWTIGRYIYLKFRKTDIDT